MHRDFIFFSILVNSCSFLFFSFYSRYFNGYELDVSLRFWFAFPYWLKMWYIFSCAYWPFVYLLWRNFFQILYSLFITFFLFLLLLNFRTCPYILYFNSLSDIWFADISLHSTGCLFHNWFCPWCTEVLHFGVIQFISFNFVFCV